MHPHCKSKTCIQCDATSCTLVNTNDLANTCQDDGTCGCGNGGSDAACVASSVTPVCLDASQQLPEIETAATCQAKVSVVYVTCNINGI